MSLRKNPVTPARLEANRRSAQKSTGPRSARGKSQSRLNGLRTGGRSRLYCELLLALVDAPPGGLVQTARASLTPAQARHPLFVQLVEIFCHPERVIARYKRRILSPEEEP